MKKVSTYLTADKYHELIIKKVDPYAGKYTEISKHLLPHSL